jgi:hypothetical protein
MRKFTMLERVGRKLDDWMIDQNGAFAEDGLPPLPPCRIRVVGQTALLESKLPVTLAATRDVDVKANYVSSVERQFRELLALEGRDLDPTGHEAWMPRETRYTSLFAGRYVHLQLALPDYVLLSKALKPPHKNHALIVEYLALGASPLFLVLAAKYQLNLEDFL